MDKYINIIFSSSCTTEGPKGDAASATLVLAPTRGKMVTIHEHRSRLQVYFEVYVALMGAGFVSGTNGVDSPPGDREWPCCFEVLRNTYPHPRAPWLQMNVRSKNIPCAPLSSLNFILRSV